MSSSPIYDRAILGAGPVGLIAALESCKTSRTLLVSNGVLGSESAPRLETVPAPLINLLIDFGVHPRRIGVDRLYDTRTSSWELATPATVRGRSVAHVDHGELQRELLAIAQRRMDFATCSPALPVHRDGCWQGTSWRARIVLDATGRDMASAVERIRPRKPWVARPFWVHHSLLPEDRALRIAALPFGYAYRLASRTVDMLWIVGRGAILGRLPDALEQALKNTGAAWLLDGFPCLTRVSSGRAYHASVQWSEGAACLKVGDAALARDILSSQGLAAGISEALFAVAASSERDMALLRERQASERAAHLQSLASAMAACRFSQAADWAQYAAFVASHRRNQDAGSSLGSVIDCQSLKKIASQ
jgi:hypothetical protein